LFTIVKYDLFTFVNLQMNMDYSRLYLDFQDYKNTAFSGRYLELETLQDSILKLPKEFQIKQIGESVNQQPIYCVYWGNGNKKVLAWSQMHGNETTTTKALFDFVNFLDIQKEGDFVKQLSATSQMALIFVLNPDGAKAYTRLNANQIDLNRDAFEVTQPEMKALQQVYREFKPNLCLNLHGQRSIFSAGMQKNPAIVSFLSPSVNMTRSVTSTRITSMQLIVEMSSMLKSFIPNQVGRYDDAYNENCIGDHFQGLETPTILFEAGHYPGDYNREETRKLMFLAFVKLFESMLQNSYETIPHKTYFEIPKNQKLYYDCILRNVIIAGTSYDFAIQYEEALEQNRVAFIPKLVQIDNLSNVFGHREEHLAEEIVSINEVKVLQKPNINSVIEGLRTKNKTFSLKILKN